MGGRRASGALRARATVALAVLALIGAACGAGPPSGSPAPSDQPAGGTLRVGVVHWAENYLLGTPSGRHYDLGLDPAFQAGEQSDLLRCCLLRTLLSYPGTTAAEGGTQLQPDLAMALPDVADDGLTWTFHLRPGLHYAPPLGTVEIAAADVIRAIERELSPAPAALAAVPFARTTVGFGSYLYEEVIQGARAFADGEASSIAGLEAPDRYTLRVHATSATGDVPYLFALPDTAPIPSKPDDPVARLGVASGHDDGYGPYLVASGPYMVEGAGAMDLAASPDRQRRAAGYASDGTLTLVRNPSWDPGTDALRPAESDRIEVRPWPTEAAALAAVDEGKIDIALDAVPSGDAVRSAQRDARGTHWLVAESNDVVFMALLNLAAPPFDDLHVRRALDLVIDRARVNTIAAQEPPAFAGPTGGKVATHIVPDGLEDDLLAGYRPHGPPDDHGSLAAASAEMAQSAYDTNHDGTCDAPACRGVLALVRDGEPFWAGMAGVIAENASAIGIEFDQQVLATRAMFARMFDPLQHVPISFGVRYQKDYPTASGILPSLVGARGLLEGGSASLMGASADQLAEWGYASSVPNVDDRIAACQSSLRDPVECWARLDQYLMEEVVPVLPLLFGEASWTVSSRVVASSYAQSTGLPALDRFIVAPDP